MISDTSPSSPSTTPITPTPFDAGKYKETTRDQWQQAAGAWHSHAPTLNAWLGPATERMLDLAGVRSGQRVLDVAAGAGEQTLAIAGRVGARGSVLATDISPRILELAAAEAHRAGLLNVSTQVMDGEQLTIPDASVDVVVSRVGLIYFPDQHRALTEMRRVLVPGGRVAAIVYSTPERNAFFSMPVSIIRRRANLGAPLPGQPGPFSLGSPGVLAAAYERAGFRDVVVEVMPAPLRLADAAACVQFERESFGALHQMLAGLDESGRDAAWNEIATALRAFEGPDGFAGPCELVIAVGTK
jgi:ubiquinone/menaquinone biosynthesis C-methylase UbiE